MIKNVRELNNLKKQYEKELEQFNGSKGDRRRIEGKLKGVIKQLNSIMDEDNTK